ncbi:cell wall metabolism sensor histidine kinase WalK [Robertmurraya korlensis]|uniref:two-component system histidine kinase PnpS n=1 Tax=Robertmurraya korlensis TaxID=519977 RepID=UPI00203A8C3F|nr:ATP-binding protein [Robertmurraya korlensis]MCM3599267.1 cell wall metabolism sensor histidine kinase WalK [Robertmurraya korlensis]
MIKFRTRLLFALIMLIFIVLIGLGLLLGQLFKGYYIDSFDGRMKQETKLVSTYIQDTGGISHISKDRINDFSDTLSSRITILDKNGNVVYDSGALENTSNKRHESVLKSIFENQLEKKDEIIEVGGGYNLHYYWNSIDFNDEAEGIIVLSTKLTEIKNAYEQIWWILTVSLGIALFVIILLGYKITTMYTKPIESATNVAIELAKGNYRARTYEDHADETGMLSSSINVLARNLQELMKSKEIQQDRLGTLIENMGSGLILIDSRGYINLVNRTYKEIFQIESNEYLEKLYYEVIEQKDICDLIEEIFMTEHKIRKQLIVPVGIERRHFEVYGVPIIGLNDVWKGILLVFHDITEIKKLEQMRKDFVANVSHELKTPITSIKGFSETLLDGAMEDKQTLEAFLTIILKESDRLQTLIQDLLDLSKMEKQGFQLSIQKINIVDVLNEVLPILAGKALEKKIDLQFEAEEEVIFVEGDVYRLKQVFINLITNAISYTPEEGSVKVEVRERTSKIRIKVIDTGIGIERKEIPRIFERFYRVDRARSRNSGGTGLGLAIVKHLIEAHRGNIRVESKVGRGTTFIIELLKEIPK